MSGRRESAGYKFRFLAEGRAQRISMSGRIESATCFDMSGGRESATSFDVWQEGERYEFRCLAEGTAPQV